jgi:hypothetical protein
MYAVHQLNALRSPAGGIVTYSGPHQLFCVVLYKPSEAHVSNSKIVGDFIFQETVCQLALTSKLAACQQAQWSMISPTRRWGTYRD